MGSEWLGVLSVCVKFAFDRFFVSLYAGACVYVCVDACVCLCVGVRACVCMRVRVGQQGSHKGPTMVEPLLESCWNLVGKLCVQGDARQR